MQDLKARGVKWGIVVILMVLVHSPPGEASMNRGINVNPWFTRPARGPAGEYLQPPFPKADFSTYRSDMVKLRSTGFDFLRVPVWSEPIASSDAATRREILENIRVVVSTALELGFDILYDYHLPTSGNGNIKELLKSDEAFEKYIALIKDTTRIIVGNDISRVVIEPINEPMGPCIDPEWARRQKQLIAELRPEFPDVRYTITGSCFSDWMSAMDIDLSLYAKDPNIFVTFHYYKPFVFTHQNASWTGRPGMKVMSNLVWPAFKGSVEETMRITRQWSPTNFFYKKDGERTIIAAEQEARDYYFKGYGEKDIRDQFAKLGAKADAAGFPRHRIVLGEFGVLKNERRWHGADSASAARWLAAVREAAEAEQFPWAMWSYKEGMALTVNDKTDDYYPFIIDALGLSK